ncbi:hypothetical protein LCGC14_2010670 [marine sediment metagenome]|uniref:Uncharacterized protein n=1 Tax=marine sediment metagenome TaxID=412755 RepID=A0A0F9F0M2_9ZZZZ
MRIKEEELRTQLGHKKARVIKLLSENLRLRTRINKTDDEIADLRIRGMYIRDRIRAEKGNINIINENRMIVNYQASLDDLIEFVEGQYLYLRKARGSRKHAGVFNKLPRV